VVVTLPAGTLRLDHWTGHVAPMARVLL